MNDAPIFSEAPIHHSIPTVHHLPRPRMVGIVRNYLWGPPAYPTRRSSGRSSTFETKIELLDFTPLPSPQMARHHSSIFRQSYQFKPEVTKSASLMNVWTLSHNTCKGTKTDFERRTSQKYEYAFGNWNTPKMSQLDQVFLRNDTECLL